MFPNDHPSPHIHVRCQGQAVRLRISDARLLDTQRDFPVRVLRDAQAWLMDNQDKATLLWATYHI